MNKNETISSKKIRRRRRGFLERSLAGFLKKTERALFAEKLARENGLLQRLDPRVKILGLLILVLDVTLSRNFIAIIFILFLSIGLAALSRVPIWALVSRAWVGVFLFTGTIGLPVIFLAPGEVAARLPFFGWAITFQGLSSAAYLLLRVETTTTLSLLLVLSTPWTHILKALRVFRVPIVFIVILGMTYRYIFVMLETAQNMFEARQSRVIAVLDGTQRRGMAAAGIGVLLTKSIYLNNEVFMAMQSRGFRGEVYLLDDFAMKRSDWLALGLFLVAGILCFWFGRQDSLAASLNLFR